MVIFVLGVLIFVLIIILKRILASDTAKKSVKYIYKFYLEQQPIDNDIPSFFLEDQYLAFSDVVDVHGPFSAFWREIESNPKDMTRAILGCMFLRRQDRADRICKENNDYAPPSIAKKVLLFVLMSNIYREYIVGDLDEEFYIICARFGVLRAKTWYYMQVFTSSWPLLLTGMKNLMSRGIFGWFVEVLRRYIS